MNSLAQTYESPEGSKPIIMVVDDEQEVRESFSVILEDRYDLAMVESGEEALSALQNRSDIRLVFLDYKLPGMSGLDVLKVLRQSGIRTPVVMVTGRGTRDTAEEALQFDIEDYITKPFRIKEIEDAVGKILKTTSRYKTAVLKAKQIIDNCLNSPVSTQRIASISGLEYRQLLHQFKAETGMTLKGFINVRRIELAKTYLREKDWNIENISAMVGFKRQNYFSYVFRKIVGITPSAYRNLYRQRDTDQNESPAAR